MQLSAAITLFLPACQADTTRKAYGWTLRVFNNWLGIEADLDAMTEERIEAYYESYLVCEKQYADRTLHLHSMALSSLCKWLLRNKYIAHNPMPKLDLPKPKDAVRKRINRDEVRRLLLQCERNPHPFQRALQRLIVTVLTTTAIRHNELYMVKLEDINLEECFLNIPHGKGDKMRDVPLGDQCVAAIKEWLKVRPADTQHPYLLAHDRVRRVSYDHINTILRRIAHQAGFTEEQISRCLPHACRRFCATNLHRNKVEIDAIKVFLGHSSIGTTEIYLNTDAERLFAIRNVTNIPLEEEGTVTPDQSAPASPVVPAPMPSAAPARDIAAPGQDKRLSRRKSIRLPR